MPPANLNGLERRNLVSACVPSHFKHSLPHSSSLCYMACPSHLFWKDCQHKMWQLLILYVPSYSPHQEVSYSQSNMRMHHTMMTGDTQHATDTNNIMHLPENLSHLIKDCRDTWIGIRHKADVAIQHNIVQVCQLLEVKFQLIHESWHLQNQAVYWNKICKNFRGFWIWGKNHPVLLNFNYLPSSTWQVQRVSVYSATLFTQHTLHTIEQYCNLWIKNQQWICKWYWHTVMYFPYFSWGEWGKLWKHSI